MGRTDGSLGVAIGGPAEVGGTLRCTVHVNERFVGDVIEVRLTSATIANSVVVHHHRWSSAKAVSAGGFEAGDAVAINVVVPRDAPSSRRFSAGAIEWTAEAVSGEATSGPTAVVITAGVRRRPVETDSDVAPDRDVPWYTVVIGVALLLSLLYPATLVSQSLGSPLPVVIIAGLIVAIIGAIVIRSRRGEPFPFVFAEQTVRRGEALEIEFDRPVGVTCTAQLLTMVDRVETMGDDFEIDRHVVDGPITKIDPGVVRTLVAIPAATPLTSIIRLDSKTEIITRHCVEVDRYGAPERSLLRTPVSRRSVAVRE